MKYLFYFLALALLIAPCSGCASPRVPPPSAQCQLLFQERAKIRALHATDHYRDLQATPYKELVRETIILDRASWCDDHPGETVF